MGPAFDIYIICAGILVLNLLFLANGTAATRAKAGKFLNPEDQKLNKNGALREIDEGITARFRRAHLNAMENILPFLPMGYLMVMTRPSTAVAGALLGGFTFFRLVHSAAYVKGVQPLRTISFAISALMLVGVVIYTVVQGLRM